MPKDGRMSVAVTVTPQYCGALGKRANCQVAVSVHAASDTASCPLQWRLFLPQDRAADGHRRTRTLIPSEVEHREKWRLALDSLASWGMKPPAVVADAAYGTNAHLRAALSERGLTYVLSIRPDVSAHPLNAEPMAPDRKGVVGCWPQPCYRQKAPSVAALARALGQEEFSPLTWRQGSKGELRSRFAALRVRPAGKAVEQPVKVAASAEQGWWNGVIPDCWLLAEWHIGAEEPSEYWLSNLPPDTPIADLVRLAKVYWRIEHDYRELKHGLGLDHYEGRSWPGWHHHVTLVTAAQAFLTERRLAPKAPEIASPSTRSSTLSKTP